MDFFPETIFRPLRGAAPSNFYTCYRLTQATQRTPPSGTGVPPKKFNGENLKFWPKIQRVRPYNFGASGSILTKLFPDHMPRGRGDNVGTTFGRPAP